MRDGFHGLETRQLYSTGPRIKPEYSFTIHALTLGKVGAVISPALFIGIIAQPGIIHMK